MSSPVNVQENIERLENSIKQYEQNIKESEDNIKHHKDEILRLEGCLIVFRGFSEAGIKNVIDSNNSGNDQKINCEIKCDHNHDHDHDHDHGEEHNNNALEELYRKYRTM